MSIKRSVEVDGVLSLDASADQKLLELLLHFENGNAVLFPMTAEVAMRIWAVLDQFRQAKGLPSPTTPVSVDKIH